MGYTTDFNGSMSITPPLSPPQVEYLQAFNETRRMKRSNDVITMQDEKRVAALLPLGVDAGYFVGGGGSRGQDKDPSVVSYNSPPSGQPGLWCQWTVDDEGTELIWDENEKFYNYAEWLEYLVEHFLKPWGCELNGQIEWLGEDDNDKGIIYAKGFAIEAIESKSVNTGPSWSSPTVAEQEPPKTAYQQLLDAANSVFIKAVSAGEAHENGDWYESWWNLKLALERCNNETEASILPPETR